jgi:putative flippase GtrA
VTTSIDGAGRFLRFGAVGVAGLVVDTAVLTVLVQVAGMGPYLARLFSYLAAVTTTWALNRRYTFRVSETPPRFSEWGRFVLVNGVGGVVNYAVYAALVAASPFIYAYPAVAVAASSLVGWVFNYHASHRFVFAAGRDADNAT